MDVLFLDANVPFSAAYRPGAGVVALWALADASLVSSTYAVQEAQSNLGDSEQRERLRELLREVRVVEAGTMRETVHRGISLPENDWPIVAGAITAGATHLITGDVRHFGPYFGTRIDRLLVLPPATYLQSARRAQLDH